MSAKAVLEQGFTLVNSLVHEAIEGLTPEQLAERLDADANPVGWLAWHMARVQDREISALVGATELWGSEGWDARFDLAGTESTGEGHTSEEVARVPVGDPELLGAYADAAHARVMDVLAQLGDVGLEEPAAIASTLKNRELLTLIMGALMQHGGQAAYVRGILIRR